MPREILGMETMLRIVSATIGLCMLEFLAGCVAHETYSSHALPESELAIVEGYWHYRLFYDEEMHIASVDGKREGKTISWPYAYSISLPPGTHWLQLTILRNSNEIARCAFEWTFKSEHRYKLQRLDHDQVLLAHPSSSPFSASISMVLTTPSDSEEHLEVAAVCGKNVAMCRQDSDCVSHYSCQTNPGFAFGTCRPIDP
jgi:hypothetical protein